MRDLGNDTFENEEHDQGIPMAMALLLEFLSRGEGMASAMESAKKALEDASVILRKAPEVPR